MAVINFRDDTDPLTATRAEIRGRWVDAMVETDGGDIERFCIPFDKIDEIVGVSSGDDIDFNN